ncbi:GSCFA domain-containing protein [Lacinutrix iliipiscaria]|uniref:GSCFA domain-containing protein n=1 Tax=Lacinutrix iliipiscaria TaxID=1230532 RepID=A0ABW5WQ26_9FLAO
MKLQTQIPLKKQLNNLIDYHSNILLLGSCFVENIGKKIEYYKFQNVLNPLGILFHPKALECLITNAIEGKVYSEEDVFFHNEQWHCFEAHSKLSSSSKDELLQHLNTQIKSANHQILSATHIVITLGTAWVYKHIKSGFSVANCHKVPQKQFIKELLSVDEIIALLQSITSKIREVNSKASIVFTVSPVRHLKDGFVENTRSKAHLITAIHQLLSLRAQSRGLHYFPSYEIMMDELRDYRFYKEDMIHPNDVAVNYIWEKFQSVWISSEAQKIMSDVESIQKGIQHKPFNLKSEAHLQFIQQLKQKQKDLQSKFSHIVF